jgi:hypothetical protein
MAGKQLVGKPAEWAGDPALHKQTRVFGAIYPTGVIDMNSFTAQLAKYKAKLTASLPYVANGSTLGDPTTAQEAAPNIVAKLKSEGVTSVFLFTDVAMNTAVTSQATSGDYHPEWIITGYEYQDISILSRGYDQNQWAHAFGISNLPPFVVGGGQDATNDAFAWFWGPNTGTYSVQGASWITWLMSGIHAAGPKLTPKTFQQGLFGTPAIGGAASDNPITFQSGFGRTVGLPYDEYMTLGTDFSAVWYDLNTESYSQVIASKGKGTTWYLNQATRYRAGEWPTKALGFFDTGQSIDQFDSTPVPLPPRVPCTDCPSTGSGVKPSASA